MQQQAEWARGRPEDAAPMLLAESETAAYRGKLSKARDLVQRAEQQAKEAQRTELIASIMVQAAAREAEFSNRALARKQATDALALSAGRDQMIFAAVSFARAGDVAVAQKLSDKLNQQFPLDTIVQTYWLPTIRASIALQRDDTQAAIKTLETAEAYELGNQGFGILYPVYVRGMAYLKARQGELAALEFKKILTHRGIAKNSLLVVLSQLQMARAQLMGGDKIAARKSYQDFLTLWKDADPDIPILQQAKAEYAKLQ
jgi:hypothetical protein